jgi:hypothetical protein
MTFLSVTIHYKLLSSSARVGNTSSHWEGGENAAPRHLVQPPEQGVEFAHRARQIFTVRVRNVLPVFTQVNLDHAISDPSGKEWWTTGKCFKPQTHLRVASLSFLGSKSGFVAELSKTKRVRNEDFS